MSTTQIDQIRTRLASHDVRLTRGRKQVIELLAATDGPRSASELNEKLGDSVPLSSLYRSLTVLADTGVLAPHHGAHGVTRYELAEWLSGHHHHLVCIKCGAVDDVQLSATLESALEDVVTGAVASSGFRPKSHALEIDGLCKACA